MTLNTINNPNASNDFKSKSWDLLNSKIVKVLECQDYFLAYPPRQPKKEIVQVLWGNATIYNTFSEAIESWEEFLLRSEHPQDYNGSSWLIDSPLVSKQIILDYRKKHPDYLDIVIPEELIRTDSYIQMQDDYIEIYEKIIACIWEKSDDFINKSLGSIFCDHDKMKSYLLHTWTSKKTFVENLTFTPWMRLPGNNYWITEDNSIKWKYHIYTTWDKNFHCTYTLWEFEFLFWDWADLNLEEIENVIYSYKSKSSHEKLDQNHNYIMEFQAQLNGRITHLQVHRWRVDNFQPDFTIDRELEENEQETLYTIWRTPKEWLIVDIPLAFWGQGVDNNLDFKWSIWLAQTWAHVIAELMSREQILTLFSWWSIENLFANALDSHFAKNLMFKGLVFSLIDHRIIPDDVSRKIRQIAMMQQKVYSIPMRIISDWKRSYVKPMIKFSDIYKQWDNIVVSEESHREFVQKLLKTKSISIF